MVDFLDILAKTAIETVEQGYYEVETEIPLSRLSLKKSILECKRAPVIAEIKTASPSTGMIRKKVNPEKVATAYTRSGAVGISVLTEPKHFKGSLEMLIRTRKSAQLPILMKDIVICTKQVETASTIGSDAVLLIQALFDRGYCECDAEEMITKAHREDLEVLLETHNEMELRRALASQADLIGINNRDLKTLQVDLDVTKTLLEKTDCKGKVVVSESGIKSPDDIRFLHNCGAQAFLVGSAIMMSANLEEKVKELVGAL